MSDAQRPNNATFGDGEAPHERRAAARIPVEMWVEESTDRELYFQRGANISLGGIFLQRTIPHSKGTKINLRFTLPGDATAINVSGEIVNVGEHADDLGMGVKFIDLTDDDRERLSDFIQRTEDARSSSEIRASDGNSETKPG